MVESPARARPGIRGPIAGGSGAAAHPIIAPRQMDFALVAKLTTRFNFSPNRYDCQKACWGAIMEYKLVAMNAETLYFCRLNWLQARVAWALTGGGVVTGKELLAVPPWEDRHNTRLAMGGLGPQENLPVWHCQIR